jgi:hypothetical protein
MFFIGRNAKNEPISSAVKVLTQVSLGDIAGTWHQEGQEGQSKYKKSLLQWNSGRGAGCPLSAMSTQTD